MLTHTSLYFGYYIWWVLSVLLCSTFRHSYCHITDANPQASATITIIDWLGLFACFPKLLSQPLNRVSVPQLLAEHAPTCSAAEFATLCAQIFLDSILDISGSCQLFWAFWITFRICPGGNEANTALFFSYPTWRCHSLDLFFFPAPVCASAKIPIQPC
jgi:hypothetical protein